MFSQTLCNPSVIYICAYLTEKRSIKARDEFLSGFLHTAKDRSVIANALAKLKSMLKAPGLKDMHPLYRRAIGDIRCALGRVAPNIQFVCDFLTNSERLIIDKDAYLDALLTTDEGKTWVDQSIQRIKEEADSLTRLMMKAIWDEEKEKQKTFECELHSANYTLELLVAARDRLAPNEKSVFHYLQNSERSVDQKMDYLRSLAQGNHGALIRLTHNYVEWRMQNIRRMCWNKPPFFEVNNAYKHRSHYISVFAIHRLIRNFEKESSRENVKITVGY